MDDDEIESPSGRWICFIVVEKDQAPIGLNERVVAAKFSVGIEIPRRLFSHQGTDLPRETVLAHHNAWDCGWDLAGNQSPGSD